MGTYAEDRICDAKASGGFRNLFHYGNKLTYVGECSVDSLSLE